MVTFTKETLTVVIKNLIFFFWKWWCTHSHHILNIFLTDYCCTCPISFCDIGILTVLTILHQITVRIDYHFFCASAAVCKLIGYIYKYNVSVNNTTLYFIYNKNNILSGRHVSTFIRSSSDPLGKQVQELSVFQCILGSQMLTDCVVWMWNT